MCVEKPDTVEGTWHAIAEEMDAVSFRARHGRPFGGIPLPVADACSISTTIQYEQFYENT